MKPAKLIKKKCQRARIKRELARKAREAARKQREADRRKRERLRDDLRTRLCLTIRSEADERDAFGMLVNRMPIALLERLVLAREVGLVCQLLDERAVPIEVEVQIPEVDHGQ